MIRRRRRPLPRSIPSNEYDPFEEYDAAQPNPDSVQVMRIIDRFGKRWRKLIYEYGFVIVTKMRQDWPDIDDAEFQLEQWRAKRQAQWLATDYLLQRHGGQRVRVW